MGHTFFGYCNIEKCSQKLHTRGLHYLLISYFMYARVLYVFSINNACFIHTHVYIHTIQNEKGAFFIHISHLYFYSINCYIYFYTFIFIHRKMMTVVQRVINFTGRRDEKKTKKGNKNCRKKNIRKKKRK